MPGFDATGPWGRGSMTGGGRGVCATGRGASAGGRGFRPARRRSAGRCIYFRGIKPQEVPMTDEFGALKQQAQIIKDQLQDIESRITRMEHTED